MLRILIVDDETNIRNMIAGIVEGYCAGAVVIGQAGSVREARQKIASLHPDLVLLDIKMNDGTGFDLLEQLDRIDFRIIFITAFQEHALRAFKFSAMDYLLKPIDPQELIHAIEDAGKQINVIQEAELQHLREAVDGQGQADRKILLKTAESIHLVLIDDILCCESDAGYTRFRLSDGRQVLVSRPLAEYELLLTDYGFFRVHKSFLVNLRKVQSFEKEEGGYLVLGPDVRVPVASRKRDQMIRLLEKITE
ncbi:MAG: LytTR family DNA-binding domain-containing protein [Bacteroidales bacterium]|jgi:two-component system LytT family response regulator|nr:LytTR family DNA-binding domain-containing protein [Bacteroidales bacterium]